MKLMKGKSGNDKMINTVDLFYQRHAKVIELILTVMLVVYLLAINLDKLAIYYERPELFQFEKAVRYICYIMWGMQIILLRLAKKSGNITSVILLCIAILVFLNTGERSLVILVLFMLAYQEYDIKKMVNINLLIIATIMLLSVSLSAIGVFPNWVIVRSATELRYCLGYAYATFLPAEYLVLVIAMFYVHRREMSVKVLALLQVVNVVIYYFTDARTSFYLATVLVLYVAVRKLCMLKEIHQPSVDRWKGVVILAPVVLLSLSLIMPILYINGNPMAAGMDKLLSGRLKYGQLAMQEYDITMFGSEIEWVGNGASDFQETEKRAYNYVDNGYLRNLFDMGVVVTVIFLLFFTLLIYKSIDDIDLLAIILLVLLWLFIEPHMMKIEMNILLMLIIPPIIKDGEIDTVVKCLYHESKERINEILHK